MLSTIPPELIAKIAYHLISPTLSPPIPLLCTCQRIYSAISPRENPNLYAKVFRANFDLAAAERRSFSSPWELTAKRLTTELEKRVKVIQRLSTMVAMGDVTGVRVEELWVVYFLLIENGTFFLFC